MLAVLLHHLIGGVAGKSQAFENLVEIVSTLHIATQSGEIVVVHTTVEQTAERVAVARERIVWVAVLIVDSPKPLVHPSLSQVL